MGKILIIAGKELADGLRNRWIVALSLLLATLSLSIAFLGSAPVGGVDAGRLSVTVVSLASLTVFLAPLIALMRDQVRGLREAGVAAGAAMGLEPADEYALALGATRLAALVLILGPALGAGLGAGLLTAGAAGLAHDTSTWTTVAGATTGVVFQADMDLAAQKSTGG